MKKRRRLEGKRGAGRSSGREVAHRNRSTREEATVTEDELSSGKVRHPQPQLKEVIFLFEKEKK